MVAFTTLWALRRPIDFVSTFGMPQAVITAQVEAGVVVRMAVLYELLAGPRDPRPDPEHPRITGAAAPVGGGRLA